MCVCVCVCVCVYKLNTYTQAFFDTLTKYLLKAVAGHNPPSRNFVFPVSGHIVPHGISVKRLSFR